MKRGMRRGGRAQEKIVIGGRGGEGREAIETVPHPSNGKVNKSERQSLKCRRAIDTWENICARVVGQTDEERP